MINNVANLEDLFGENTEYLYGYTSTDAGELDAFLKETGFYEKYDPLLLEEREDFGSNSWQLSFYSAKGSERILMECRDLSEKERKQIEPIIGFPVISRFRINLVNGRTVPYVQRFLGKLHFENQNTALINDIQTKLLQDISRSY